MNKKFQWIVLVQVTLFLVIFAIYTKTQFDHGKILKDQSKVQKEAHMLTLYGEYLSNVNGCRFEAEEQGKDQKFIQENCIELINNSLLGNFLISWGYEDLLIKK